MDLDTMDADQQRARRSGGMVVALADEATTMARRYGDLGVDPGIAAQDVIFEIGSVTKLFTATLLAVLARRGTVQLETPVDELLPSGVSMPTVGRPVTLADLASHASGLPRLPPGWILRAWRRLDNPYAGFTEADLWTAVGARRGRKPPGRSSYSNYGGGLLGHLLTRVTGTGYADLVGREICLPLGMADTTITVPDGARSRLAPGHTRRGKPTPGWDFPVLTGAGALHSTATDLLTFLRAQWSSPPPTVPDDLAEAIRTTHAARATGRGITVGLGWIIGAEDLLWHNGGTGGYRSYVAVRPQRRGAVVVLANSARSVDGIGSRLAATGRRPLR
jgi:CubicO group peptidase (beta-lactamase class C family)